MKEKEIRVLMVEPNKHPEVTTLRNELDALQKAVSIGADYQGLIEVIRLEKDVCILCNEESKLIGLEGNRRLGWDILAGVFYVTGVDRQGNFTSLPEDKLLAYEHQFWEPEHYTQRDVERSISMCFF